MDAHFGSRMCLFINPWMCIRTGWVLPECDRLSRPDQNFCSFKCGFAWATFLFNVWNFFFILWDEWVFLALDWAWMSEFGSSTDLICSPDCNGSELSSFGFAAAAWVAGTVTASHVLIASSSSDSDDDSFEDPPAGNPERRWVSSSEVRTRAVPVVIVSDCALRRLRATKKPSGGWN